MNDTLTTCVPARAGKRTSNGSPAFTTRAAPGIRAPPANCRPAAARAGRRPRARRSPAAPGGPPPCSPMRTRYSPSSGKWCRTRRAAARAERQVLAHAVVLHQQRRQRIAHRVGLDGRVAHGQPADPARRRHVALQQPRSHGQDVGVVVEAVGEIVGRQHRPGIDLQVEQIADGVRVLQAVEAMDGRPARVRLFDGGPVEGGLQPRRERAVGRGGPAAGGAAAASPACAASGGPSPRPPRPPPTCSTSMPSRERFPVSRRSLWQVTQ